LLHKIADDVPSQNVRLLDPRGLRGRHTQTNLDVGGQRLARAARETDRSGTLLTGGFHRPQDVTRPAAGADARHRVPIGNLGTHLAGEDLAEIVVVADRRENRRVGGQGRRRQRPPLAQETAHALGGHVLRIRGAAAGPAEVDCSAGPQYLDEQLAYAPDGAGLFPAQPRFDLVALLNG
jgi:hypothetical protein